MKKQIAFILALLLACGTIIGCEKGNHSEETAKHPNETVETEPVETKAPETKPVETNTVETVAPETDFASTTMLDKYAEHDLSEQGFSIKGKGYYYKGNNSSESGIYPAGDVLLFDVTNETDTDYSVTLTVTYFDENGKKVKTEKQVFEQYSAGYQRYFLFAPYKSFEVYTYEMSVTEYKDTSTDTINLSSLSCEKLSEKARLISAVPDFDGTLETVVTVKTRAHFLNSWMIPTDKKLIVDFAAVVFDNTGEIHMITQLRLGFTDTEMFVSNDLIILDSKDLDMKLPEELKGELTIILAPKGGFELIDRYPSLNG